MSIQMQIRRGTAAEWTSADPILADGEMGFETDTEKLKFGDGTTVWSMLSYFGGGGSSTATGLQTATTVVVLSAATAPTAGQVLTAIDDVTADWENPSSGFANPMTTLGDIIYEDATPVPARLAGNTTSTKKFLRQTGTGSASAAPAWDTVAGTDLTGTSLPAAIVNASITAIGTLQSPVMVTPALGAATGTSLSLSGTITASGGALGGPTATTQSSGDSSTKVATTAFVQNALTSYDSKPSVQYCSTSALPSNTYDNGTSGVGATLTGSANGPLVIDGATIVTGQVGTRVLVAGESTSANNGWYTITQIGVVAVSPYILTRATESDQAAEIGAGYLTSVTASNSVTAGSSNNGKVFISVAADPFTVGTTALTFSQVGNVYNNGNGISLSGQTFSIDTSVTVDKTTAQTLSNKTLTAPVIGAATGTSLSMSGAITATGGTVTNLTMVTPTLGAAIGTSVSLSAGITGSGGIFSGGVQMPSLTLAASGTTAGVFSASGANVLLQSVSAFIISGSGTFTGGIASTRITPRVTSATSAATLTGSYDTDDILLLTAQSASLTLANPSGTPTSGQRVIFRIKDNGTSRSITYGTTFRSIGVGTLPAATTISKTLYLGCIYNSDDTKLDVVAVAQEA